MKYSVIDIGSNSMRLTVYEADGVAFRILFREKIMAGLAGYVEGGYLSEAGIVCAYQGLLEFKNTLELLGLEQSVCVFATASLRNITNTEEAVEKIHAATGFHIEVISGAEEALFGYAGAMQEVQADQGVFVDIGGASTEITVFSGGTPSFSRSYPVGSLKLYRDCVKKILPGPGSAKRVKAAIMTALAEDEVRFTQEDKLICVGGTARSVLKIARQICALPEGDAILKQEHLKAVHALFFGEARLAADVILKTEPERIHTIIPGFMLLEHIVRQFRAEEIVVSKYGVREGYLCQKILRQN